MTALLRASLVGVGMVVAVPIATAQTTSPAPDEENRRFTFSQTVDGVLRLDSRTGSISSCHNRIAGWACYAMPDEKAALTADIAKLRDENERLKGELAKRQAAAAPLPPFPPRPPMDVPRISPPETIAPGPPPLREDANRVVALLQRAWRRLVALASGAEHAPERI